MKRKKDIRFNIILIRVIAIFGFSFAAFNCYRGFANEIIPVAIAFLFIGIVALIIAIKPKFIIDEN